MLVPKAFQDLIQSFSSAFSRPSFLRMSWLTVTAILTRGPRTVSNMIRTLEHFSFGHASSFHRFFSRRRWENWSLGKTLTTLILSLIPEDQPVYLAGDDTVDGHPGRHVYGKGCHRDAVRSSHKRLVYRWGHKWVVLSVLIQFPWSKRRWALPCLIALYRTPKTDKKERRRHKTGTELMEGLLAQIIRWFPSRKFIFCGDQEFGTQELAFFAHRFKKHLCLVSRLVPNACLYMAPPLRRPGTNGRPRIKGEKLLSPAQTVELVPTQLRQKLEVQWYGGGPRLVRVVSAMGYWYRGNNHRRGIQPIPIRWVYVQDLTGTHRDEYFFTTDVQMTPQEIIENYVGRWNLETTFQEMRSYIGLETTHGWSPKTVLRMAPCLFGLYSLTILLYCLLVNHQPATFFTLIDIKDK
jgi:hypothetical protein